MVFATENPYENRSPGIDLDRKMTGVGQVISRYTQDHAVILDYDGVMTPPGEQPAIRLIQQYHDEDHISDDDWEAFRSVIDDREDRGDREFEGELLSIATQALEGEKKGDLRSTTADFVAEHRDEVLSQDADDLIAEQQAQDREVYVVSNNYRLLFEALSDTSNINLNNVYSNVLAVSEDNGNTVTGSLRENVYEGKGAVARSIGDDRHIWAAAGDSMSDYPLLLAAEHAYTVDPSDELLEKKPDDWSVNEDIGDVAEDMREKDRQSWTGWFDI